MKQTAEAGNKPRYLSICQHCVWRYAEQPETRVEMLTTYSLTGRCDTCGTFSELAMCKAPQVAA